MTDKTGFAYKEWENISVRNAKQNGIRLNAARTSGSQNNFNLNCDITFKWSDLIYGSNHDCHDQCAFQFSGKGVLSFEARERESILVLVWVRMSVSSISVPTPKSWRNKRNTLYSKPHLLKLHAERWFVKLYSKVIKVWLRKVYTEQIHCWSVLNSEYQRSNVRIFC